MKNDNLKSYVCDYTIEYNVQVNPVTNLQFKQNDKNKLFVNQKIKKKYLKFFYENDRRIKDKMMYGKVHTWLNYYHDTDYEDNVKTKLIDTKIREVSDRILMMLLR